MLHFSMLICLQHVLHPVIKYVTNLVISACVVLG